MIIAAACCFGATALGALGYGRWWEVDNAALADPKVSQPARPLAGHSLPFRSSARPIFRGRFTDPIKTASFVHPIFRGRSRYLDRSTIGPGEVEAAVSILSN